MKDSFSFQQFTIRQDRCAMKVGTDGVLLGAWADCADAGSATVGQGDVRCGRILDIGTGTGLLALMLAQRFPTAFVDAVEIDGDAASQAQENVAASPFADRVSVWHTDVQSFRANAEPLTGTDDNRCAGEHFYDLIVSNPPYFQHALKNPDKQRQRARHTDGSLSYRELFLSVGRLLADGGTFCAVIPVDECLKQFVEEANLQQFYVLRQVFVKTTERKSPKRCLLAFSRRRPDAVLSETKLMTVGNNERSPWYQNLTKEFYL